MNNFENKENTIIAGLIKRFSANKLFCSQKFCSQVQDDIGGIEIFYN